MSECGNKEENDLRLDESKANFVMRTIQTCSLELKPILYPQQDVPFHKHHSIH